MGKGVPGIYKLPGVVFFFVKALVTPPLPSCLPNRVCFHPKMVCFSFFSFFVAQDLHRLVLRHTIWTVVVQQRSMPKLLLLDHSVRFNSHRFRRPRLSKNKNTTRPQKNPQNPRAKRKADIPPLQIHSRQSRITTSPVPNPAPTPFGATRPNASLIQLQHQNQVSHV